MVAPVGSHIHGRLVRLVEDKSPRNYYEAEVRLDSIEVGGTDLPLYAVPAHQSTPPAGTARKLPGSRLSDFVSSAPRNIGTFFFDQKHRDVRQWDSNWLTTLPEASAGANKAAQLVSNTPQQVSENEAVQNFVLAIRYSQEATDLLGSNKAAASITGKSETSPHPGIFPKRQSRPERLPTLPAAMICVLAWVTTSDSSSWRL